MNLKFQNLPNLRTNRVLLRAISNRDTDAVFALRTDREVNQYLDRKIPTTHEQIRTFIAKTKALVASKKAIYWVLETEDEMIGSIGLRNYKPEDLSAEIGYELLPTYMGIGIMSEVLQEILSYAFEELSLQAIIALTHKNNQKSIQLLRKFGFRIQVKVNTKTCFNSYILNKPKPQ
ncbi:GNAT family N-acetyltransferase [Tenacibaculum sp. SG-28]|uniref:GNAT family N-acetyltransferase n=1 Tax=Tenacibaculum sp. SG-28 TaxID=754426 RepID=UPI000CF48561|nr:GNAT family N-acetyltransferase [Tenacibaculum sp. SG-28]PQJ23339.1 hypothetical protein BSU00_03850 [Tenacibaculum sp. SG-28]